MSTTDLAQQVADLTTATTQLTNEVVGQKARLTTAADIATSKASDASGSASAASASAASAQLYKEQASQIAGLDDVVGAMALAAPGNLMPDVYIPFNDSLEIVRGYGTHDQIDVSAAQDGSVMVGLPSKSVDFSRASGRTVINKSGELVTLGVDEPAIGSDGLEIYGSYANKLLWSEDFSNEVWVKPVGLTVTQDGTLSSDGVSQAWLLEGQLSTPLQQPVPATTDGTQYLFYHEVKIASSLLARVRWIEVGGGRVVDKQSLINLETGEVTGAAQDFIAVKKLNNGWWGVWWSNATNNTGNAAVRFDIGTGEASGSIYASRAMIVESAPSGKVPYIKTESTPITSSPDVASIPMRNNMPAAGRPFTILADIVFGGTVLGEERPALRQPRNRTFESGFYIRLRRQTGLLSLVQVGVSDGSSIPAITASNAVIDGVKYRVCLSWNDGTTKLYVDGVFQGSATCLTPTYSLYDPISIGSDSSYSLNGSVENLEIYHRALTDDEIKAKGAAK